MDGHSIHRIRIKPVADPNKPISQQLLREAKIGLTIVAMLVGLFCYVAWNRFSGNWDSVPEHVANAPIATNMNEAFREQHRQHLAQQNRGPAELENQNHILNRSVVSDPLSPNNNQIEQTFTSDKSHSSTDGLANSPSPSKSPSPFQTNDLRSANSHSTPDSNVNNVSYDEEATSEPKNFDDPFGKESNHLEIIQPKTDENTQTPRKPFELKSRRGKDSSVKETKAQLKHVPQQNENTFRPRTQTNQGALRPSVVMQSTKFQVQVDPEPTKALPQGLAIQIEDTPVKDEFSHEVDLEQPKAEEYKPLVNAGDFATHSLHPVRPSRQQLRLQDTLETVPSEKPPVSLPAKQESVTELKGQYTVQNSDQTLWAIAQDVYGDGRLFQAIYEMNRNAIANPDQLIVGTKLITPPIEEVVKNLRNFVPQDLHPEPNSPLIYETSQGDTLFDIARQKLGQASRFDELVKLNRKRLPLDTNHLSPLPAGMQLRLPAH